MQAIGRPSERRPVPVVDMSTTMIYTHVLKLAAGGKASPLDALGA